MSDTENVLNKYDKRNEGLRLFHLDPEKKEKWADNMSVIRVGKPRKGRAARGEANALARRWYLKDSDGRHHSFVNLREFVRNNLHLFDPEDARLVDRKISGRRRSVYQYCRAYAGLAQLNPAIKRHNESWKGWTWDHATELYERELLDQPVHNHPLDQ